MTVRALKSTAQRIQALAGEAAELGAELERLVAAVAPWLLELPGMGPISAAQVLVSWSHAGRLRSEGAFAAVAGVNPIPASSGQVTRHRLNRSGDRQLNRALHTIVLARLRDDPTTRAYAARRRGEGKSVRDIRRCLKRAVARQLFKLLERYDRSEAELGRGDVDAAELLSELEGAFGLGPVGQEPAGLPAQRSVEAHPTPWPPGAVGDAAGRRCGAVLQNKASRSWAGLQDERGQADRDRLAPGRPVTADRSAHFSG